MESKKPKRKRRTKAEMQAARKQEVADNKKESAKERLASKMMDAADKKRRLVDNPPHEIVDLIGQAVEVGAKIAERGKVPPKSEGLGDKVEKVLKATGVKAFVEYMNGGEPCEGCEKRKAWLNKVSRRKPKTLTLDEFKFIESIKDKKRLTASENINLAKTHARVYRTTYEPPGNCSSCAIQKHKDLVSLYEAYLKDL